MSSSATLVDRCMALALDGIRREYPNRPAHVRAGPEDVAGPREVTPIFYGCFDWHSAVHHHWTLVRTCRLHAKSPLAPEARRRLRERFVAERVAGEVAHLAAPGRASFERPYGLAWLLQLAAELHEWDDADAQRWRRALEPLEELAAQRLLGWLPRLSHPVRTGEHSQTAFALGLALDWARSRGREAAAASFAERARTYYLEDAGWSLAFEPGGEDFLSPALAEADLLRRVLAPPAFSTWLTRFLPELGDDRARDRLQPCPASDRADGRLAHLDGLNLSRAWMLEGILRGLAEGDGRRPRLERAARAHREAGLAALAGEHYEGTHWLGTFAIYLLTRRGP